ncbi:MAG: hypothetical protein U1G07_17900 [Verrucomicrobiota bacterium]
MKRPTSNSRRSRTGTYDGSARYGRDRLIETLVRWGCQDQAHLELSSMIYLEATDVPKKMPTGSALARNTSPRRDPARR